MVNDWIRIRGARTHNLKNIDVNIPRNRFTVVTGLSGSGKSSLAFDTLYAEGQRRYAESVSAYARRFMDVMDKPDVDSVQGLSPSVSISQHTSVPGSRSTVATVTETADYLRLLFSRAGRPFCPHHNRPLARSGIHDMVDAALRLPVDTKVMILAPVPAQKVTSISRLASDMSHKGFIRLRIAGAVVMCDDAHETEWPENAAVDVVVDRLRISDAVRSRLAESFEAAVRLFDGRAALVEMDQPQNERCFSVHYGCPECGYTASDPTPSMFSFNSALGACPVCQGAGRIDRFDAALVVRDSFLSITEGAVCGWSEKNRANFQMMKTLAAAVGFELTTPWVELPKSIQTLVLYGDAAAREAGAEFPAHVAFAGVMAQLERQWRHARSETSRLGLRMMRSVGECNACAGTRFRREVLNVYLGDGSTKVNIADVSRMSLTAALACFEALEFDPDRAPVADGPLSELKKRLTFLIDVGLGYLTLNREASTLSGGEMQRIRLAGQIGSGLTGVTYVLDEPTIGLHQRDNEKLIGMMKKLAEAGNTVIAVEHDPDVMRAADWLVDMGPGAGEKGGTVVGEGTPADIMANEASLTGAYLARRRVVTAPAERLEDPLNSCLTLVNATGHNLKGVTCHFPLGAMTVVTGVSGSGKSTLVNDTLGAALRRHFHHAKEMPLDYETIEGLDFLDKVIDVDQSPIGKTPRSNPATYTGLFTLIRDVFAQTSAARERGYDAGRFSFNTPGGRCEACEGDGVTKVEMGFLPPVYVTCSTCGGRRYNRETLEVKYRGKNIHDVLEMTVDEALEFFSAWPVITRKLQTLTDVGLGYIRLGQSAVTFSGGEAQRIKLAEELSRRDTGNTLYILDEPTTGLHFEDVALLLKVLRKLTSLGNTVVVIEHNLDVVRLADWVVDIGPDGGAAGGELVIEGRPEDVATCAKSLTGRYLLRAMAEAKPARLVGRKAAGKTKVATRKKSEVAN